MDLTIIFVMQIIFYDYLDDTPQISFLLELGKYEFLRCEKMSFLTGIKDQRRYHSTARGSVWTTFMSFNPSTIDKLKEYLAKQR